MCAEVRRVRSSTESLKSVHNKLDQPPQYAMDFRDSRCFPLAMIRYAMENTKKRLIGIALPLFVQNMAAF
jgi:hypothetical protein